MEHYKKILAGFLSCTFLLTAAGCEGITEQISSPPEASTEVSVSEPSETIEITETSFVETTQAYTEPTHSSAGLDPGFPPYFSLKSEGLLTPVRDQGCFGTCTAFAWSALAENRLLAQGKETDISEWALWNTNSEVANIFTFEGLQNFAKGTAAFVPEEDAPYPEDGIAYTPDEDVLNSTDYVLSDIYFLSNMPGYSGEDARSYIKQFISNGYAVVGALACTQKDDDQYYKYVDDNKGTFYAYDDVSIITEDASGYHAVLFVGWNDNYSKSNFSVEPENNGAWLVKNSWGTSFGTGGYCWVSYEDKLFEHLLFLTADIIESGFYDTVQGYDTYGWNLWSDSVLGSNTSINGSQRKIYQACTFTAEKNMDLTAVSFYTTHADMDYKIYIIDNLENFTESTPVFAEGTQNYIGYHQVQGSGYSVKAGEEYSVVILLESETYGYFVVQDSYYRYPSAVQPKPGKCFVSLDGSLWEDVANNVCSNSSDVPFNSPLMIKAYGLSKENSETNNPEIFNGHTYQFFESALTWEEAQAYCESMGGHLATVGSQSEQDFLTGLTSGSERINIWIGGKYDEDEGKWLWVDGSGEISVTDDKWDATQPYNLTGADFYMRYAGASVEYALWSMNAGKWIATTNDSGGETGDAPLSSYGFVCEWDEELLQ